MRQHGQDKGKEDTGQIVLQWQLCENEAEWQLGQQPTIANTVHVVSQRRQRIRRWFVVLGVTLLGILVGVVWYQAQLGVAKIESELQSAIDAEAWLPVQQQPTQFKTGEDWQLRFALEAETLHSLAEPGELVTKIDVVDMGQEWAVVQVVVQTAGEAEGHRQTRFYHRTDEGWLRAAPDVSLWGASRRQETDYFIFEYHQRDAQAVAAVAAEVDTLYTTLLTNFGLPLAAAEPKLRVEVNVMHPPGTFLPMEGLEDPFILPSPALYLAPDGMTDTELLTQALALHLVEYVSNQAQWHYTIPHEWPPILAALRLWQLWELDLPLSVWQDEVVEWVYGDLYLTASEEAGTLPEHYSDLCAAHALWMESPQRIRIPMECEGADDLELKLTRWNPIVASMGIFGWGMPFSQADGLSEAYGMEHPGKAVALATLFEYAAVTYGREKLPALIAGFGRYEGWEALLPAVLGVSAADFETGWRSYLTQTYNVSLEQ